MVTNKLPEKFYQNESKISINHQNSSFIEISFDLLTMLAEARQEGKSAAADLYSILLDKLAAYAATKSLNVAEIIHLMHQEAEAISSKCGTAWL